MKTHRAKIRGLLAKVSFSALAVASLTIPVNSVPSRLPLPRKLQTFKEDAHAGHDHGKGSGHSCACEAEELGFTIDCSNAQAMLDAVRALDDLSCAAADCSAGTNCEKQFLIVQSHHDYCSDYPSELHTMHDYEGNCLSCDIEIGSEIACDHDEHEGHDHDEHEGYSHDEREGHSHDDHEGHSHYEQEGHSHDEHEGHDHGEHEGHDHDEHEGYDDAGESQPWGKVIGASLLVNLATFSGVALIAGIAVCRGVLKTNGKSLSAEEVEQSKFVEVSIPGFAVGALLATAVFLILPESVHLIEGAHSDEGHDDHSDHGHRFLQDDHSGHDDHSEEGANAAKFGCAVLGGFLLPLLLSIFFHHVEPEEARVAASASKRPDDSLTEQPTDTTDAEYAVPVTAAHDTASFDDSKNQKTSLIKIGGGYDPHEQVADLAKKAAITTKPFINKQLCASILIGDGFHNFGDGLFIAAAFKSCASSIAVSIMLATLFHEIAQELADFIVLARYGGLPVKWALFLNFTSGLTVMLGGIVFLASNPTDQATGIILAMAGGVYFYVAGCETIPRAEKSLKSRWDRVNILLSIIVGTIPIGLILMDHEHCG